VLVIGGGLAGMTAAIAAARGGARVRLLTHKASTLRNASGLIDVLGTDPESGAPLADPFDGFGDLPDEHPYRTLGEAAVREGLDLFDDLLGDRYLGSHTDRNALVPTHGGTVKPTARYPAATGPGLASIRERTLLVGFETITDFDAPLAAAHLDAAGVPFAVAGVTLSFPGEFRADARVTRMARALDEDHEVRADGRATGTRATLADRVADHLDGAERVGFPALLGDEHGEEVREELADRLGTEIFEVPMGPPSLPGLRLEDALEATLYEEGVRVESGNPVVGYDGDDRVETVTVERVHREVPYGTEQVILATGGLVGKGIRSSRSGVREPIFGCHVPQPEDRYDWFRDGVFDDQPYARFGVRIDDGCRPLDERGETAFENLRAVGAVCGGYDSAREKSASGVSLATAVTAGRRAAEAI
jgi:glycerol-3-phosphate dehydrogenase subunit B